MNAYVEIIAQLIENIPAHVWKEQRFFPFVDLTEPHGKLFDVVIFSQFAWGALGIAWVEFSGYPHKLTLPFRLARYNLDGDLITMPPWSLRDASSDGAFYEAWKQRMYGRSFIYTEKGGVFSQRDCKRQANVVAVHATNTSRNVCVRVESQETVKLFRVFAVQSFHNFEVEMLEYLNQQNYFLAFPHLISIWDYAPRIDGKKLCVAISTRFIHADGTLWHDILSALQCARFMFGERDYLAAAAWKKILQYCESLGRLLGDFHRAMVHARENRALVPEPTSGENRKLWLSHIEEQIFSRISAIQPLRSFCSSYAELIESLGSFATTLLERLEKIENLGLRIRIHGRAHLGHILYSKDGLFLTEFGDDEFESREFLEVKQSGLKDIASLILSLRYAWHMTNHRYVSPIAQTWMDAHDIMRVRADALSVSLQSQENIAASPYRLRDLEHTILRFYLSALGEDPSVMDLVPQGAMAQQMLLDVMLLMRILRELRRDYETGNPRCEITLAILQEFFFEALNRSLV